MQRIKSVGVLSCAKILEVLYGCMGLLFLPFLFIAGWPAWRLNRLTPRLAARPC